MLQKVSLYIPAYNAEKTIRFSLEAILNQTFKFNEIIVINDCSTDKTLEVISSFKNQIKIINNNLNRGLGYCRNYAISISQNNLVASIDADVVPDKNWLENLLNDHKNNNSSYTGGKLIEKNIDKNIFNKWRSIHLIQNWGDKSFKNPPFVFGCNNILNKEVISKIGLYDEDLKTNGEDVAFSKKLSESDISTYYSERAYCFHIQHDNLISLSKRYWRYKTFAYKIKKFSFYKFIKMSIKEFKILLKRVIKDISKKKYDLLKLEIPITLNFIYFEFIQTIRSFYKR